MILNCQRLYSEQKEAKNKHTNNKVFRKTNNKVFPEPPPVHIMLRFLQNQNQQKPSKDFTTQNQKIQTLQTEMKTKLTVVLKWRNRNRRLRWIRDLGLWGMG